MTRNRPLAVLLCLLLLLLLVPVPARAEEPGSLTVGEVGGERGKTVTLEVSLDAVNGIAGGSFNVVYAEGLTLVSAKAGIGGGTVNPRYAVDTVRISFAGTKALSGPGSLLTLTFRISDSAPLDFLPVTVEKAKFYDKTAEPVSVKTEDGGVQVSAVQLSLSSDSCLPGQAVKLEVLLSGDLYPAGGAFEVHCNPRLLSAGSVKAEEKLGDVAINLSSSIDEEAHVIRVSWAAAEAVGELGRLCTVIFAVDEKAAGETAVTIENLKCYDEEGQRMDCLPPVEGTVTIVDRYKEQPMLYIVGGERAEDGTATLQVAVDGAGLVCGGTFELAFESEKCELLELSPMMACVAVNPEKASEAGNKLQVSWAEDSAALDNETVLQLKFRMKGTEPAALRFSGAVLKDNMGDTVPDVTVNGGEAGVSAGLQRPMAELVNTETALALQATLFDARFCGETPTEAVRLVVAAYAGGRFLSAELPEEAVEFDENGIAHLSLDVLPDAEADGLRIFFVDTDGNMTPMCEKTQLDLED